MEPPGPVKPFQNIYDLKKIKYKTVNLELRLFYVIPAKLTFLGGKMQGFQLYSIYWMQQAARFSLAYFV